LDLPGFVWYRPRDGRGGGASRGGSRRASRKAAARRPRREYGGDIDFRSPNPVAQLTRSEHQLALELSVRQSAWGAGGRRMPVHPIRGPTHRFDHLTHPEPCLRRYHPESFAPGRAETIPRGIDGRFWSASLRAQASLELVGDEAKEVDCNRRPVPRDSIRVRPPPRHELRRGAGVSLKPCGAVVDPAELRHLSTYGITA
jgi:hypothetical protein